LKMVGATGIEPDRDGVRGCRAPAGFHYNRLNLHADVRRQTLTFSDS
jgi:hypothetical protein